MPYSRVVAALLAMALSACDVALPGENGGALSGTTGNVEFILVPQTPVVRGENDFSMTLVDVRTLEPLTGAKVTLQTTMPETSRQTTEGLVQERTAGSYLLRGIVFDEPGNWTVRVHVNGGGITDEVVFPFNVP